MQARAALARKPQAAPPSKAALRPPARRAASAAEPVLQAKLRIGPVDDPLERDADRIADAVVAGRFAAPFGGDQRPGVRRKCAACAAEEKRTLHRKCADCEAEERTLRRKCAECEAEEDTLRREADTPEQEDEESVRLKREGRTTHSAGAEAAAAAVARGGAPLPRALRGYFEPRLGRDLADVRIHTGAGAGAAAAAINARAYTLGSDIAFAPGAYAPETRTGQRLIAHELAHVVQQGGGGELLQRDDEEDVGDLDLRPGRPDLVPDPVVKEPGCPRTPTLLGNLTPVPSCNEEGEDIDGIPILFCRDSDILRNAADLEWLRAFVASRPSGTEFHIRAYASQEGPGTEEEAGLYNRNLSCHRLNRILRELINLGVQEADVDAAALGSTERWGKGAGARHLNRAAVIKAVLPARRFRPDPAVMTVPSMRDEARRRIVDGDYAMGADAYFARWTCGRYRLLSDAVSRTNILIEGVDTQISATDQLGMTAVEGANTIVLSPLIANATDPIGCAANRIVDLTFHHFSRPVLPNFADQHRGGMHLVHLAGLPECRIKRDPLAATVDKPKAQPLPTDPFAGRRPRCADVPLPGPLENQRGPTAPEVPPTFTVTDLSVANTSGPANPMPPSPGPTVGVDPATPFRVNATVEAAGDPAMIARYHIGVLQTVMAENWENTHVDGRRERRRFPMPLRDGAPTRTPEGDPPWFDVNAHVQAAPGVNRVAVEDQPQFRAFTILPDIPLSRFFERRDIRHPGGGQTRVEHPTIEPVVATPEAHNNVPDRGRRLLALNTWVVARREVPRAPATLGATEFLQGLSMMYRISADWRATPDGQVRGTGNFALTSQPAPVGASQRMLLRGATPLDFVAPNGVPLYPEFVQIDPPRLRAAAGGLTLAQYAQAVQNIVQQERRPPSLAGKFDVRVKVDVTTGRVILDTPDLRNDAVTLATSAAVLRTVPAREFARRIFPGIRKLVAAPGIVSSNEPQTGTVTVPIVIQPVRGAP